MVLRVYPLVAVLGLVLSSFLSPGTVSGADDAARLAQPVNWGPRRHSELSLRTQAAHFLNEFY
jgi:hypothetical protein